MRDGRARGVNNEEGGTNEEEDTRRMVMREVERGRREQG